MKIVFFGTPDFAVPSLRKLYQSTHDVLAVITSPSKASGRGQKIKNTDIYDESIRLGIHVIEADNLSSSSLVHLLKNLSADIFVIVAFRILPEKIFSIPKHGTVNLHASLLPKYRGSAPIHHAILNGETQTGITTFQINNNIDAGLIYLQEEYTIDDEATTGMVWNDLSISGADLLIETLDGIEENSIIPTKQNIINGSRAPKLDSKMYCIDWGNSSIDIHNQIRAFSPKPGAYTKIDTLRIKLFESSLIDTNFFKPGFFKFDNDRIIIGSGKGDLIVKSVQLEGKKRMSVESFYKGAMAKFEGKVVSFG